jgi:DNA polymerase III delta subunit
MPGLLTPRRVREQIERGEVEPLYLVTGEDEAEMGALASALAGSVEEDVRAFNVQRFYGTDAGTTLAAVLDAAGTFPLLAPRRVVLLMQAQVLLAGRRAMGAGTEDEGGAEAADAPRGSELSLLRAYAERPHAHAVVALFGRGLGRQFGALSARAAVVTCDPPADPLSALAREYHLRFDAEARQALEERAGGDLSRLRDDVERIALFAAGRSDIGKSEVDAVVSRPTAARGSGALWKDVANRRTASALAELGLELAEGAEPVMLLGLLRSVVEKTVAPRDLARGLEALLRTDLALKTGAGQREAQQVLLERLVVELCELGRN